MQTAVKKMLTWQAALFLAGGLLVGLLVIRFSDLPGRFASVAILALAFPFIAMMAADFRRFLLMAITLSLPIALDVNIKHLFENQAGAATIGVSVRDVLVVVLLLWWIVETVVMKKRHFHFFPRITVPAFLYLEACILTLLWAPRSDLAIMEIVQMSKALILYFIVANQLRSEDDIRLVLRVLTATVLLEGALAVLQLISGRSLALDLLGEMQVDTGEYGRLERVGGTLGHPNRLAMYLELLLPLCFGLSLLEKKRSLRFFAGLSFGFGLTGLILTGSRGGWIGVLIAMLMFFFLLVRNRHVALGRILRLAVFFLIILSSVGLLFSETIENRLFGDDYNSAIGRIPMFQIAWSIIQDHPFGGVGINNYAVNMREYNDTLIGRRFTTIARPVHNMYLLIAGETGLLGLSLFLWLLIVTLATLVKCFRSRSAFVSISAISILAGLCAFFIHGFVDKHPPGGNAQFYLLLALTAALYVLPDRETVC